MGFENFNKIGFLEIEPTLYRWIIASSLVTLFLLAFAFIGVTAIPKEDLAKFGITSSQISNIYLTIGVYILFALIILILGSYLLSGKLVGGIDDGKKKNAFAVYVPAGILLFLSLVFFVNGIIAPIFKALPSSISILGTPTYPFLLSINLVELNSILQYVILVGVLIPIIEEDLMGLIAGFVGRITRSNIYAVILVVTFSFVLLHIPTYYASLQIAQDRYQKFGAIQETQIQCTDGYYYDYKVNSCMPNPPMQKDETFKVLLAQLASLASFRIALTLAEIYFNSLWVGRIAHSLWNTFVVSFVILGKPIYALLSVMLMSFIFVVWYVTERD